MTSADLLFAMELEDLDEDAYEEAIDLWRRAVRRCSNLTFHAMAISIARERTVKDALGLLRSMAAGDSDGELLEEASLAFWPDSAPTLSGPCDL